MSGGYLVDANNGNSLKIQLDCDTSGTASTIIATDYQFGTSTSSFQLASGSTFVGSGNADYVTSGGGTTSITGGAGADDITLGGGVDTVVFESTAAGNGNDTIHNFTENTGGDVLNVNAFLGTTIDTTAATGAGDSLDVSIGNSLDYGTNTVNVIALNDIQTLATSNFGGTASATVIKTAASSRYFVLADVAGDADSIKNAYYVSTDSSNAATVTLVGTINEVNMANLVDANFA